MFFYGALFSSVFDEVFIEVLSNLYSDFKLCTASDTIRT